MSYQVINSKVIIDALPETMRFRGAWQAGSYLPNEVVTYQSQTFIALVETSSATDSADWAQLADKPDAHDLVGVVEVANGGTGSSTPAAARVMLGLEIGVDVQAYNADAATKTFVTSITNPIQSAATTLAGRVTDAEGAATTLTGRVSSAESAATTLTGRVTSAENSATTLSGRVDIAESDIAAIETAATTLTGRVSTAEGDINAIETAATTLAGRVADAESELVSQDGRLDSLEGTSSALGSMAQQNSSNVSITGGSIAVGSLESTGTLSVSGVATLNGGVNITTGLQVDTLTVTGSAAFTGSASFDCPVDMTGDPINNLGAPTLVDDAATKGYVDQKVADLIGTAPDILDTFQELATALQNDETVATALAGQVGGLDTRLTQAEADIDLVEGRAGDLENRATSLETITGDHSISLGNLGSMSLQDSTSVSVDALSVYSGGINNSGNLVAGGNVTLGNGQTGASTITVYGPTVFQGSDVNVTANLTASNITAAAITATSLDASGVVNANGFNAINGGVTNLASLNAGDSSLGTVGAWALTLNQNLSVAGSAQFVNDVNITGATTAGLITATNVITANSGIASLSDITVEGSVTARDNFYAQNLNASNSISALTVTSDVVSYKFAHAQFSTMTPTSESPVELDPATSTSFVIVDAHYCDCYILLPDPAGYVGRQITIKKSDDSDNMIAVGSVSGQVDGEGYKYIPYPKQSVTFMSLGGQWICI